MEVLPLYYNGVRFYSFLRLKPATLLNSEAHSEPSQRSKIELFGNIVNDF